MKEKPFRGIGLLVMVLLFLSGAQVGARMVIKPGAVLNISDPSLRITSFMINNGAAGTTRETVTLNNAVQGDAGEYRASMNQDFQYAQWHAYSTAPTFNLGGVHGTKTIYFQVRSSRGLSNVVSDSIRLESPPPQPLPGSASGPGPIVTTPRTYPVPQPARPPVITSFVIENGAATTPKRRVSIRFSFQGSMTHYRISTIGDTFPGAEWIGQWHLTNSSLTEEAILIPGNVRMGEGDGLKTMYLQLKDNLGQVSSVAKDSITFNELPTISVFNIPQYAYQRAIPLYIGAWGATHWRAGESRDFVRNLQTGPLSARADTPPTYTLSEGFGRKTVYLQVTRQGTDNMTLYSNIVSKNTEFVASGHKDFTISGYDAYKAAEFRGFGFSTKPNDPTSQCRMWGNPGGPLVLEAVTSRVVGSKCDFILFSDKQLNERWSFKSYGYQKNCIDGRGDSSVIQQPSSAVSVDRNLKFQIHVWADPPGNLFGEPSGTICDFFLNSITLEGPENASWEDAFNWWTSSHAP